MQRKLVKQGRSALTVTLPSAWLKKKGLQAGDSISISENPNSLILSTSLRAKRKQTQLDLRKAGKGLIYHSILGKYMEGYDIISVTHDKPALMKKILPNMIGMVIQNHNPTSTTFKSVIKEPEANFMEIFTRATHLLTQQARNLVDVAKKNMTTSELRAEELLLDSTLLYCIRYLNKYSTQELAYRYHLLCSTMELAGDQIRAIGENIKNNISLAEKILKLIDFYCKNIRQNDLHKIQDHLYRFKQKIPQKTFLDGLVHSLRDNLYNYIGYLVQPKISK